MSTAKQRELVRSVLHTKTSRRKLTAGALAAGLPLTAFGHSAQARRAAQEQADLLFTFWGSPQEKTGVEAAAAAFAEARQAIAVEAQHIPNDSYQERIATMVAGGSPPDVAYIVDWHAESLAAEDQLLDLAPVLANHPTAGDYMPQSQYHLYGKYVGVNIGGEAIILYYNRDLFDEAGFDYPPSTPDAAWTWDEFVSVAQRLTRDRSGNDATSPDFDPNNIQTYGASIPYPWYGYVPFIYSNGGRFANEEGTELVLNQPEAVEALQQIQDLIHVHHVIPNPASLQNLPTSEIQLLTRQAAMAIDGHWKVLDFSQQELNWSMGVLPRFQEPATVLFSYPMCIFAATEYPEAAVDLFTALHDPTQVDLFKKGLWMPVQASYYTDAEKTAAWLDAEPGVYPPEARGVLVDFVYNHSSIQPPTYWLKNQAQIFNDAVIPAMDLLWTGQATAQAAMDQAVSTATPLMQGRATD